MIKFKSSPSAAKALFLIGSIFLFGFSCHQTIKTDLPTTSLRLGDKEIVVEVANKPATRSAGLMFRKEMDIDNGMLFVFPDSAPRSFWMKNTMIPLSIAFIDEKGIVLNILEMPPETENSFFSRGSAKFALEMNSGWFDRNKIKPGDAIVGVLSSPKAQE